MKVFVTYLKDYFRNSSVKSFVFTLIFVTGLVFLNYTIGLEKRIRDIHPWPLSLMSFFFFYGFVLFFSWAVQYTFGKRSTLSGNHPDTSFSLSSKKKFLLLLLLAPLYFSFKMIHWDFSLFTPAGWQYPWNQYTLIVLQLPAKLLLLFLLLYTCWKMGLLSFFGLTVKNFNGRPYFLILLFLVPLIALASTRPDFLHTYPKVKNIAFINGYTSPVWPWQILYEISYGLDFLSIELFFRGFLVIGLARYAGEYAILPMAAFYCTIHFGKPLGECISSFFGGLALGVIALRTRSIFGGLIVHLGLAWLMELGGWLGHLL
jgi:hypothetical protein